MSTSSFFWPEIVDLSESLVRVAGHEVVYSTVVLIVVAAVSLLMRRAHPMVHFGLWSLVFVRLLLPPGLGHPYSVGAMASSVVDTAGTRGSVGESFHVPWEMQAIAGSSTGPDRGLREGGAVRWHVYGVLAWLVGFSIVTSLQWRRRRAVARLLASAQPVNDAHVLEAVAQWRSRLRVRRPVRVVSADSPVAPFVAGVLRPTVFLPRAVLRDSELAEVVVAHEMVHVARWDALWLHVQVLIQALYFFHPGVWLAGLKLSYERERVCDATVLRSGEVTVGDYARSLIDVAALDLEPAEGPALRPRHRRLRSRVLSLRESEGRSNGAMAALAVCLVIAIFVLPLAGGTMVSAAPEDAASRDSEQALSEQQVRDSGTVDVALVNPVPNARVSASYGKWINPFSGADDFHRGIDLAARAGTPVYAPAGGTVRLAEIEYEKEPAAGTVIIIDHGNGVSTFFAHLGAFEVFEGEEVSQGDTIAFVGSTGRSTGPHLHFEVRIDGENVDPAVYVQEWQQGNSGG